MPPGSISIQVSPFIRPPPIYNVYIYIRKEFYFKPNYKF
jgi:hypothetical protein